MSASGAKQPTAVVFQQVLTGGTFMRLTELHLVRIARRTVQNYGIPGQPAKETLYRWRLKPKIVCDALQSLVLSLGERQ
jgi:hypothetical protein